jgi:flagellar export protein FliJ
MPVFTFRLQRVLKLRAQRERELAATFAQLRREAEVARDACALLESARQAARAEIAAAANGAPVGEIQSLAWMLEQLDRHVGDARSAAEAAEARVRQAAKALGAATRERQVFDRLRERYLEEWRAEEAQADRRTMDSVALARRAPADRRGPTEDR